MENHKRNIDLVLTQMINQALPEEVDPQLILRNDDLSELGLNSIGMIKLLTEIEKSFDLEMDDEFLLPENFNTLSKIKFAISRTE